DERRVRGADVLLAVDGEADLGEQPPSVLGRVLVVYGKQAKSTPRLFDLVLSENVSTPRQIRREWLTNPVVQQEDSTRREDTPNLREDRQRFVDDVQLRRHGHQWHASRGVWL